MQDFLILFPMIITLVFADLMYFLLPTLSRKTLSFGVTVPESLYNDPILIKMRHTYRKLILFCLVPFLVSITLVFYFRFNGLLAELVPVGLILFNLLVNSAIFLLYYHKMRKLKSEKQWIKGDSQLIAVETSFRKQRLLVSPWWFSLYILIILVSVLASIILYDNIPDKLGMRISSIGETNVWVDKSWKSLAFIPSTQLFLTLVFGFAYSMLNKSRLQIDPANREKTLQQNIISRFRWSVFLMTTGCLLLMATSLTQFSMMGFIAHKLAFIATLIIYATILISVVTISLLNGQSGSRIQIHRNKSNEPIVRDDDKYWKLGMFYYNPDDSGLFIEKRMSIGWTINWGRPMAWVVFFGLILVILGFSWLSSFLVK